MATKRSLNVPDAKTASQAKAEGIVPQPERRTIGTQRADQPVSSPQKAVTPPPTRPVVDITARQDHQIQQPGGRAKPRGNALPPSSDYFKLADQMRTVWSIALPPEFEPEQCLERDFLRHHAHGGERGLRAGDLIEVRTHDHTFFGTLYCRATGPGWAECVWLKYQFPLGPDVRWPKDAPLQYRWNKGKRFYEVYRAADGVTLSQGYLLREMAVEWMREHIKMISGAAGPLPGDEDDEPPVTA